MARLELFNTPAERRVVVTLSKRNLLTLLRPLETPGPRMLENNDCYEDDVQTPWYPGEEADNPLARTTLVLRCEADEEHYGNAAWDPASSTWRRSAMSETMEAHRPRCSSSGQPTPPETARDRLRECERPLRLGRRLALRSS